MQSLLELRELKHVARNLAMNKLTMVCDFNNVKAAIEVLNTDGNKLLMEFAKINSRYFDSVEFISNTKKWSTLISIFRITKRTPHEYGPLKLEISIRDNDIEVTYHYISTVTMSHIKEIKVDLADPEMFDKYIDEIEDIIELAKSKFRR